MDEHTCHFIEHCACRWMGRNVLLKRCAVCKQTYAPSCTFFANPDFYDRLKPVEVNFDDLPAETQKDIAGYAAKIFMVDEN